MALTVKMNLLETLGKAGLSPYEARCYLVLLEKETLTVSEISHLAKIPRSNAYEVLEKLLSKGMCVSKPGKQKRFGAVNPDSLRDMMHRQNDETFNTRITALKQREREVRDQMAVEKREIDIFYETLESIYRKRRQQTDPLDYIEIIKDPYQAHRRYLKLVEKTKDELLVLAKPPYSGTMEDLLQQEERVKQQLQRNLRLRSIYEIPQEEATRSWFFAMVGRVVQAGAEARISPGLPLKVAIFDRRTVMLALEDPGSEKTSLTTQIVEHGALAESLRILFDTLWLQAREFNDSVEPS